MADLRKISTEIKRMVDKIYGLETKLSQLESKIQEMHRETGSNSGREMYRQVDDLQMRQKRMDKKLNQVERDVTAIRRLVEFGDSGIKEIQQALSLIYKNTDELEDHLLGEERQTK
jgi:predicted RNase H-like nuclease (RuvC/YqgF family)